MAKIYGLQGAMTGKLGASVMVVRFGEQIVRQYQPVVSNPNTEGQVAQRAKLKLMSQLSAVMGPYIAMPRVGASSVRNQFVKKNFGLVTFSAGEAEVNLSAIQLTKSVVALPTLHVTTSEGTVSASLSAAVPNGLDRVVYLLFVKQADNTLRYFNSIVADEAGSTSAWPVQFTFVGSSPFVLYAYGVRDNTDAARVVFGEMEIPTAEQVAKILTSRTLTSADVTMTETQSYQSPSA